MSGFIFADFEYNRSEERDLNLVCCSTTVHGVDGTREEIDWWLHKDLFSYELLKDYFLKHQDKIIYAWSVEAEARSMLALGLDVLKFTFVDLFYEYRMIKNQNHELMYGRQLIDGKVKRTFPYGEKGKDNLAAATYKLLNILIDTDEKTRMRDLIISAPDDFTEQEQKDIMSYCRSDVKNLPRLKQAMIKQYEELIPKKFHHLISKEAKLRGNYAARTAKMSEVGYPVNVEWLHNFSSNVPSVMETCIRDINSQFEEEFRPFRWNKAQQRFSMHQQVVKDWIIAKHGNDWELTKTKDISLALDAFTKKYHYAHEYPEGHLAAQMIRYLKLKQAMNGFNPNADKTIFECLGSDGRIRPYHNPYGAQSSRTQPGSTGFIFLKPAWIRSMVQPRPGKAIGDYDWSSEEFLLSALCSRDRKMLEAYRSGDVYLAFGKMIGWIPQSGTKESHKFERDVCKSLVLGLSYLMTKYGLARKLTEDTGKLFTEEQAQELVEEFEATFQEFSDWRALSISNYTIDRYVRLPCGFYMFGDNDNFRSVGNVPIQGCLHGDSRVPTLEYGFQKIKDLSGRNNLHVWDGTRFVEADCVPAGKKQKVVLEFFNGQKVTCSPEHKFWTISNRGIGSWKTPSQFTKQTFIRLSDEVTDFSNIQWPEVPYSSSPTASKVSLKDYQGTDQELGIVLGRLASDGWVAKGKGMSWTIAEHEENILPYLKDLISKLGLKVHHREIKRKDRNQKLHTLQVYSQAIESELLDIDIKNSLSHPFLWSSKELLQGFLKGYVDGDGGLNGSGEKVRITISFGKGDRKEKYARDIQRAFSVFGITTRLHTYPYRTNLCVASSGRSAFIKNVGFLNNIKQGKLLEAPARLKTNEVLGRVERVKTVTITEEFEEMYDIANCPEQRFSTEGFVTHNTGASIMRKAVCLAQDAGLTVIFTLHDAIYIEYDSGDFAALDTLKRCMDEAFLYYFDGEMKEAAKMIRVEGNTWSPDYEDGFIVTPNGDKVTTSKVFIDPRAKKEYNLYHKYMENSLGDELLCLNK